MIKRQRDVRFYTESMFFSAKEQQDTIVNLNGPLVPLRVKQDLPLEIRIRTKRHQTSKTSKTSKKFLIPQIFEKKKKMEFDDANWTRCRPFVAQGIKHEPGNVSSQRSRTIYRFVVSTSFYSLYPASTHAPGPRGIPTEAWNSIDESP